MFERYTERARRVIFFARYEASNYGSPYIETQHLLIGLVREATDLVARFNLDPEKIRKRVEECVPATGKTPTSVDLPLSNEGKRVLAYAAEEAERMSHRHIGTEHLLLGLLRERDTLASVILSEAGLDVETTREQLRATVDTQRPIRSAVEPQVIVEYVSANEVVARAPLTELPRVGDEVSITYRTGELLYVVETVRFMLAETPVVRQPLSKELVRVQVLIRPK